MSGNYVDTIKKYPFEFLYIVLLLVVYWLFLEEWVAEWLNFDSFYSFGVFMVAFIAYYLYKNFDSFKNVEKFQFTPGIIVILLSLAGLYAGIKAELIYLISMSLPAFIFGIVLTLYGYKIMRYAFLPIFLFTFTLPIFPLHKITLPLKLFVSEVAASVVSFLGVNCYNEGSTIIIENYRISVTAGCSGLKSLFSLFFISLIYSYFLKTNNLKKVLFVLSSIPVALVLNATRIILVSFYALYNGYDGVTEFHDNIGIVFYVLAIIIIVLISKFVEEKEDMREYEN